MKRDYRILAAERLEALATKQQAIDELALKVRDLEEDLDESDHTVGTLSKELGMALEAVNDVREKHKELQEVFEQALRGLSAVGAEKDSYLALLKRCYWFLANIRREGGEAKLPLNELELREELRKVVDNG